VKLEQAVDAQKRNLNIAKDLSNVAKKAREESLVLNEKEQILEEKVEPVNYSFKAF
jgi:hypothetical protein